MPGMDETGPMGYGPMTGGRRGRCAVDATQPPGDSRPGTGGGVGRRMGFGRGGRGYRNEYYATGLTGWQRAAKAAVPASEAVSDTDRLERIEAKLTEALDRLSRLERTE